MDQSVAESDITMSPGGVLHQIIQRIQSGSLSETPSSFGDVHKLLDLLSSNSTSYTTFQRILLEEDSQESSPFSAKQNYSPNNTSLKLTKKDLVEGVSVMNISKESEFLINSPLSRCSGKSNECTVDKAEKFGIRLDEMPILKSQSNLLSESSLKLPETCMRAEVNRPKLINKKPFLRRGEGTSRFGVTKKDFVIQPTNTLPWKRNNSNKTRQSLPTKIEKNVENVSKKQRKSAGDMQTYKSKTHLENTKTTEKLGKIKTTGTGNKLTELKKPTQQTTWANVLTSDQEQFLRQVKQESFYKNFVSPAKSTTSDVNESLIKLSVQREQAEQNMFNLLENKYHDESITTDESFYKKLFKKNTASSGMNTPTMTQKFLEKNPNVFFLHPQPEEKHDSESESQWEDCEQDDCSHCCTQSDFNTSTPQIHKKQENKAIDKKRLEEKQLAVKADTDNLKKNMAEMNAKLVETGDLLKQRLHDLEDEIDAFRKENVCLGKMRQELEAEKAKFYEEKVEFEKKYNEEKILAEYYLAEEKEKLAQKKLHYDRCVREMRGRLTKKDKDEVVMLKKEVEDMKEQMKIKDAKSTTCIARLRNQIKILEKENEEFKEETDKLKRENMRIKQVNTTTRRLSNIKYLSEINKKLSDIGSKISDSDYGSGDIRYRSLALEERSRSRKKEPPRNVRAKSVPNLAVTSHYAQYFSKRNENNNKTSDESYCIFSDDEAAISKVDIEKLVNRITSTESDTKLNDIEEMYHETFRDRTHSPIPDQETQNFKPPEKLINEPHQSGTLDLTESTSSLNQNKSSMSNMQRRTEYDRNKISLQTNLAPKEIQKADGSKELRYPNGNVKIISADRKSTKFLYYNGDVQETFFDEGIVKYYYANNKTYQTTYKDGTEVLQFPDGQIEKKYRDGSHEVHFPNGSVKYVDPKNKLVTEEWRFPDGAVLTMSKDGEKFVRFPNGQVEVHTTEHKRREYPDGTVKFLYADGTTETRFSTGRVRIKDKNGKVIMDTSAK